MSRKHRAQPREVLPDPRYQDIVVTNSSTALMFGGKKSTAEKIFLWRLEELEKKQVKSHLKFLRRPFQMLSQLLK
jgi:small subunit ribosomal protein S7